MGEQFILGSASVVVLARNYNPSIVSKEWLYDKNIIREAVSNFVHSPVLSVVETNQFSFVLDENKLQISLKSISASNIEILPRVAKDFVSHLPETPYVAIGFNYRYRLPKEKSQLRAWFNPDDSKLRGIFTENYEVGFIISFTSGEFITRISVPPTKSEATNMTLDVNFHSDCRGVEAITDRLSLHNDTMKKMESILTEMCKQ